MRAIMTLVAFAVLAAGCASASSTMLSEDTALVYATGTILPARSVLRAAQGSCERQRSRLSYFVILRLMTPLASYASFQVSLPMKRTISVLGPTFGNAPKRRQHLLAPYTRAARRPVGPVIRITCRERSSSVEGVWMNSGLGAGDGGQ